MKFFGVLERGLSETDAWRVEYALRLASALLLFIFLGIYLYLADMIDDGEGIQMAGGLSFFICISCIFVIAIRMKHSITQLKRSKDSSIKTHYVQSETELLDAPAQLKLRNRKLKISLLWSVACSVVLLPVLVVAAIAMVLGKQLLCAPFALPDMGSCPCDSRPLLQTSDAPEFSSPVGQEPVLIAQFGDTTLENLDKNLRLVRDAGADLLIINGDLTYYAKIDGLEKAIKDSLGEDFPVLNTVGNHDTGIYTEYQAVFQRQYNRYRNTHSAPGDLLCEGEIGVSQLCSFRGIGIVLSGIGSTCSTDAILNAKLVEQLQALQTQNVTWKNIYIHKNQKILQTGGKRDEVGWAAYEAALASGAIMHNGHEHAFARTKQISAFDIPNQQIATVENTEFSSSNLTNGTYDNLEVLVVKAGATHVVLNGIGGRSVRSGKQEREGDPWWSAVYNSNVDAVYATHFCEYRSSGRDDLAYCYLENIRNEIIDQYLVISE